MNALSTMWTVMLKELRDIGRDRRTLALTLLPSQGHSQGIMNLLNALGGGGSTTSNTGGGLLGAITGGGAPAGPGRGACVGACARSGPEGVGWAPTDAPGAVGWRASVSLRWALPL